MDDTGEEQTINVQENEVHSMPWSAKNGEVSHMAYASFGHGDRVLVILPGLSDGLSTVKGKALLLAKPYSRFFSQFTVYMFSRKNEMPVGYSIRDMARDQVEALRLLGIKHASVMGVSQGGLIAQCLAIDHPDLVERLILAVTAPRVNPVIKENVEAWIRFAEQGNHKDLMIDTAEKSYSPDYLRKYRKLYPIIGSVGKPNSYDRFLVNTNAILRFDVLEELDRITCPTLIIGGNDDRIVGVQASYEMRDRIAGSKLFVYPGLGHAAYEEAKDFNQRVFEFLEEG